MDQLIIANRRRVTLPWREHTALSHALLAWREQIGRRYHLGLDARLELQTRHRETWL